MAAGADVNTPDLQGYTPFLFALIMHSPHADAMPAHGADVRRVIPLSAKTATMYGNISVNGASISFSMDYTPTPGMTPLMFAVRNRSAALVRSILAKGVDVNARDAQGKTALSYAENSPKVRALLLRSGAHP